MAFGIDDIIAQGLKLANKFIKDPTELMKHKVAMEELYQKGDLATLTSYVQMLQGQIEINKIEAASTSLFKSGWRPFIGWVCGSAFAYKFLIQPLLVFCVVVFNPEFDITSLPELNWTEMSTVLMGMLGLGTLRTFDKAKGSTHR